MKWMIACMALVATTAMAGEANVRCDENEEDCVTLAKIRLGADGGKVIIRCDDDGEDCVRLGTGSAQVLYVGDDHQPRFLPAFAYSAPRGYLGISTLDLTDELRAHFGVPEEIGVMISRVEKGSPAEEAGVEVGDILTRLDEKEIATSGGLARAVRRKDEGETIDLEIWRDGRSMFLAASVAERERATYDLSALLGVRRALDALGALSAEDVEEIDSLKGRYIFRVDPEAARDHADQWRKYAEKLSQQYVTRSLPRIKLGSRATGFVLENDFELRIQELEEKLKALQEEIESQSGAD
jgi:hypothetical protein